MKLLKYENAKLKNQFIFNIPVSKDICGRKCPGCYALKPQLRFPTTVLPSRERNYAASLSDDFESRIITELSKTRRTFKSVRIHESGEWYSQAYIDKWVRIAQALPNITFYSFTKRLKDFDFSELLALPNVVTIDSLAFGGLNYDKLENLDQSKPICPDTLGTPSCGTTCNYCWTKQAQSDGIQFVKH